MMVDGIVVVRRQDIPQGWVEIQKDSTQKFDDDECAAYACSNDAKEFVLPNGVMIYIVPETDVQTDILVAAEMLVRGGFYQTSSKYGMLARVPPGKTAIQALREADPRVAREIEQRVENQARSAYLRTYVGFEDKRTITPALLRAFRELGGEPA